MSYNRNYDDKPVGGSRNNFDDQPVGRGNNSHDDQPVGRGNNTQYGGSNNYNNNRYDDRGGRNDNNRTAPPQYGSQQQDGRPNNQYNNRVRVSFHDIVMWRNVKVTGTIVASLAGIIILFGWMEYTVVTFLCRLAQFMFAIYSILSYLGRVPPSGSEEMKLAIHDATTALQPLIVNAIDKLFRIFAWEDAFLTIKCLIGTIMLGILGNAFSDLTLLFLGTVVVFAAPLAYARNKDIIDPIYTEFNTRASQLVNQTRDADRHAKRN